MSVLLWVEGRLHQHRFGHWPNWFELGAGHKECVECLFKRSGGPRGGRQRLILRPMLNPLLTPVVSSARFLT
jgi:hypothetical protein